MKPHCRKSGPSKGPFRTEHFERTQLEGANLQEIFFDNTTRLVDISLGSTENGYAYLADVHWHDVNLGLIEWSSLPMLGEEYQAQDDDKELDQGKPRETKVKDYQRAVRANRQIATILRNQGMNEEAAQFAYSAQNLQRYVLFLNMTEWQDRKGALKTFLQRWAIFGGATLCIFFLIMVGIFEYFQSQQHRCSQSYIA